MDELAPSWVEVAPRLTVVVRTPVWSQDGSAAPLVRVPFAPLLSLFVAIDHGDALELLTADVATRLERSFEELAAHAVTNLDERPTRIVQVDGGEEPGTVWRVEADDGLASSRIVSASFLEGLRDVVGPHLALAIPEPGTLLAGDARDEATLERLVALAAALWRELPRAITPVLYTADEEGVVTPLEVDAELAVAKDLARMHAELVADVYEAQREILEPIAEASGEPIRVEECRVVTRPSGESFTVTTLLDGYESALPVTDVVLVAWREGEQTKSILVAREDLLEVLAGRSRVIEEWEPPRIVVAGFPNEEELAKLQEVALATMAEGD